MLREGIMIDSMYIVKAEADQIERIPLSAERSNKITNRITSKFHNRTAAKNV